MINYSYIKSNFRSSFFQLTINEKISDVIKEKNIPNTFGVYIFYKNLNNYKNIIYIGKAGEINNDGSQKNQGLQKRLKNSRNNIDANNYFKKLFNNDIDKIIVEYFEVPNSFLTHFIEASLIQEYFSKFNKLPYLNKCY